MSSSPFELSPTPVDFIYCKGCSSIKPRQMFAGLTRNYKTALVVANFNQRLCLTNWSSSLTSLLMRLLLWWHELSNEMRHLHGRSCVFRNDLRKHQVLSLPSFDCKGEIKGHINKEKNWIHLEVIHDVGHPSHFSHRVHLTEQERQLINNLAVSTSTPEIHRAAVDNFGHHITHAQVYYWQLHAIQHLYRLNDDPMVSARMLIGARSQQRFEELASHIIMVWTTIRLLLSRQGVLRLDHCSLVP
ncbi:hypothetical protein BC941DRAFT_514876 [Chlamydoabsidia padenii]|nr:hypothetical protein BC941DRAFT_514876 [Chlamydoabsidia padenii]